MNRSVRFPDELVERIRLVAAAEDRSFNFVVVRTLERALGGEDGQAHGSPVVSSRSRGIGQAPSANSSAEAPSPAPPRASSRTCGSGCVVPVSTSLKRCVRHGLVLK